mgnify:CR=1 FL=1|tara:strand:+ start:9559 stop:10080 length:522 start_codon:yes stop_codon:yes gene_type:complete
MKQVKSVKMGFNKKTEVVLIADVEMSGKEDVDSLFLCYFTILIPPLRLSVLTTDCLLQRLAEIVGKTENEMKNLLLNDPQQYAVLIQSHTETLMQFGVEQSKIALDNSQSANQARALVASIIKNGYYIQKSRFHFPEGNVETQEQVVEIKGMESTFQAMLDVCKNWKEVQENE